MPAYIYHSFRDLEANAMRVPVLRLLVDLATLHTLNSVVPVTNANFYVVYARHNRMDTVGLDVNELSQLARMHGKQLFRYTIALVRNQVEKVLTPYIKLLTNAEENSSKILYLPEAQYKVFSSVLNNLKYINDDFSNWQMETYRQCLISCRVAFEECASGMAPATEREELIPIDHRHIGHICKMLLGENSRYFDQIDTFGESYYISLTTALVKCSRMVLMLLGTGFVSAADRVRLYDMDGIYNKFVKPQFAKLDDAVKLYVWRASALDPATVLALDGGSLDQLDFPRERRSYENDAAKLATLLTLQRSSVR